jgi:4-hydroxy-3-polyprenylbenzoate decarboxylase
MLFADLRGLLQLLESRAQPRRIKAPVTRNLEITEIADRVAKGPAGRNLARLFEHVQGLDLPATAAFFGSPR